MQRFISENNENESLKIVLLHYVTLGQIFRRWYGVDPPLKINFILLNIYIYIL